MTKPHIASFAMWGFAFAPIFYCNSAAALISVCVNPHASGTSTKVHASITPNFPLFSAAELELDAPL